MTAYAMGTAGVRHLIYLYLLCMHEPGHLVYCSACFHFQITTAILPLHAFIFRDCFTPVLQPRSGDCFVCIHLGCIQSAPARISRPEKQLLPLTPEISETRRSPSEIEISRSCLCFAQTIDSRSCLCFAQTIETL